MVFLARMPIEDVEADKAERAMKIMVDTSLETLDFSLCFFPIIITGMTTVFRLLE